MRIGIRGWLTAVVSVGAVGLASAQKFEPGYVVVGRGDTLRGEVENAFWEEPPEVVRFRTAATAPVTTYRSKQVRALELTGGRRLRRELLPIDYRATKNVNRMPRGLVISQQMDSVLADVLVEGPASLLAMQTTDAKHFFVKRENAAYLEMTERRYIHEKQGALIVMDGNNYHAQLAMYFGDCSAAVAVADKADFTADDLANVVQTYNRECSAERQVGHRVNAPARYFGQVKVLVGPVVGARYNSMRLRSDSAPGLETPTLHNYQLDGRVHAQGGVFFDVVHGGRRLALHTALLYSRFGARRSVAAPDGSAQWAGVVDWRGSMVTLRLGLRVLRPVGASWLVLVGSGVELPGYWDVNTTVQYGADPIRLRAVTNRVSTPTSQYIEAGFAGTKLPYLEVGVRHQRFTLSLCARRYGKDQIYDYTSISRIEPDQANGYGIGYEYSGRTISTTLSVGYQLNSDADKKRN